MSHGCQTYEARHYAGPSQEKETHRQRASLPGVPENIPQRATGEIELH